MTEERIAQYLTALRKARIVMADAYRKLDELQTIAAEDDQVVDGYADPVINELQRTIDAIDTLLT